MLLLPNLGGANYVATFKMLLQKKERTMPYQEANVGPMPPLAAGRAASSARNGRGACGLELINLGLERLGRIFGTARDSPHGAASGCPCRPCTIADLPAVGEAAVAGRSTAHDAGSPSGRSADAEAHRRAHRNGQAQREDRRQHARRRAGGSPGGAATHAAGEAADRRGGAGDASLCGGDKRHCLVHLGLGKAGRLVGFRARQENKLVSFRFGLVQGLVSLRLGGLNQGEGLGPAELHCVHGLVSDEDEPVLDLNAVPVCAGPRQRAGTATRRTAGTEAQRAAQCATHRDGEAECEQGRQSASCRASDRTSCQSEGTTNCSDGDRAAGDNYGARLELRVPDNAHHLVLQVDDPAPTHVCGLHRGDLGRRLLLGRRRLLGRRLLGRRGAELGRLGGGHDEPSASRLGH
mmetsp:Transcript_61634/g.180121  ORF Transcript_61634/g.180121 Transcript_61634/m.180121 type:complete len:407 (-) Transcript_61634:135-1355(-)